MQIRNARRVGERGGFIAPIDRVGVKVRCPMSVAVVRNPLVRIGPRGGVADRGVIRRRLGELAAGDIGHAPVSFEPVEKRGDGLGGIGSRSVENSERGGSIACAEKVGRRLAVGVFFSGGRFVELHRLERGGQIDSRRAESGAAGRFGEFVVGVVVPADSVFQVFKRVPGGIRIEVCLAECELLEFGVVVAAGIRELIPVPRGVQVDPPVEVEYGVRVHRRVRPAVFVDADRLARRDPDSVFHPVVVVVDVPVLLIFGGDQCVEFGEGLFLNRSGIVGHLSERRGEELLVASGPVPVVDP